MTSLARHRRQRCVWTGKTQTSERVLRSLLWAECLRYPQSIRRRPNRGRRRQEAGPLGGGEVLRAAPPGCDLCLIRRDTRAPSSCRPPRGDTARRRPSASQEEHRTGPCICRRLGLELPASVTVGRKCCCSARGSLSPQPGRNKTEPALGATGYGATGARHTGASC